MKELSNRQCVSSVLGEVRDNAGTWHTGFLPYSKLADMIGTTSADLMRRLVILGIVEHAGQRHKLTDKAIRKRFGMVRRKRSKGKPDWTFDVILPEGMVEIVTNLEATNLPETEIEKLSRQGLPQSAIAQRFGVTQQAVSKHLRSLPPRLKDWPILGSWDDDEGATSPANDNTHDNHRASAA